MTWLKFSSNLTDMDNVKELTVLEIAEKLGINFVTVKSRIRLLGIQPVRKVGRTNIYDPSVVEQIRNPNSVGRPKKAASPEPVKPAASKNKKAKKPKK